MRNGTKLGLIAIALAYLAASTALSLQAVRAALVLKPQRIEVNTPCAWKGRLPADI